MVMIFMSGGGIPYPTVSAPVSGISLTYPIIAEVSIGLAGSDNGQNRTVYIHREQQDGDDDGFYLKMRVDGWLETELSEFFNGGDEEGELLITINSEMKVGLLIQGIEIRPKKE